MLRDLENLITLQGMLSRLTRIETLLEGVPPHLQEIHDAYETMAQKRITMREVVEKAQKRLRVVERDLEELKEKKQSYRQQLMQVSNQKEYGAVLKEIDTMDQKIREMEDEILTLMEEVEENQTTLDTNREAWEKLDSDYSHQMQSWTGEKKKLEQEKQKLEDEKKYIEFELPEELKQLFQGLYKRYQGMAVVPLKDYACSGCHVKVRPQQYAEIRKGQTIRRCDQCTRILYYDEQES